TLVIKALTNGKIDTSVKGDVDFDGKVSISDVTTLQKYIAKSAELDDDKLLNADFNGDGEINISDVTAIQKHIAKIR
ncbi:MAG: dockerin type I repeat-containing protein, partial [Ruminococcus sp.]|nr:dockerin type I repeat-containing protein [Ruminococcus sp.]